MWLPRLRFTLVPRSSRSPFRRGVYFPLFPRLGVFCKFFSPEVRLRLCFSQARGARGPGPRALALCFPNTSYGPAAPGVSERRAIPTPRCQAGAHRPPQQVGPCPEGWHRAGRARRPGVVGAELGYPPRRRITTSSGTGLIKMKPALSFGGYFFLILHNCSF